MFHMASSMARDVLECLGLYLGACGPCLLMRYLVSVDWTQLNECQHIVAGERKLVQGLATHTSEEPVSRSTLTFCGGVPTSISAT